MQNVFSSKKNLYDTSVDPKELNGKILTLEIDDINMCNDTDAIPIIEIQIEEMNSTYFKFDEIYIYREDTRSTTAPCYYVIYMAYDAYYNPHYVCYDTTVQVGPKKLRQIIKYAYNPQFKLYKVKVVNPL